MGSDGESGGPGRRDVEASLLGEQTGVVVELAHLHLGLIGEAEAELLEPLTHVADLGTVAGGGALAPLLDSLVGAELNRCEAADALGLEGLVDKDRHDAEGMLLVVLEGPRDADEQLFEVHAGGGLGTERAGGVVGVHSTVPIDHDTQEVGLVELPVGT